MDGTARVFDVSDPHQPKQIYEQKIGAQLNMVSQSWDGEARSTSPRRCSRTGTRRATDNEQFLKAYDWDGKELTPRFAVDFTAEKLGRPHMMAFGAAALYTQ